MGKQLTTKWMTCVLQCAELNSFWTLGLAQCQAAGCHAYAADLLPAHALGQMYLALAGARGGLLLSVEYCTRGPGYMEVDIDVGSSSVAATVVGLVQGATKSLVVDMGIVLEGHSAEELPESLLGTVGSPIHALLWMQSHHAMKLPLQLRCSLRAASLWGCATSQQCCTMELHPLHTEAKRLATQTALEWSCYLCCPATY